MDLNFITRNKLTEPLLQATACVKLCASYVLNCYCWVHKRKVELLDLNHVRTHVRTHDSTHDPSAQATTSGIQSNHAMKRRVVVYEAFTIFASEKHVR